MVITFTRAELLELLGVAESGLKTIIKRGKLEDRIKEVGYELVSKQKVGRSCIYELEFKGYQINDFDELQTHWRIKRKDEHMEYVNDRVNNLKTSRREIIENNEVLKGLKFDTAKRWDDKLEEENIIKKDGYVYFRINNDGTREECTKEDFDYFWKKNGVTTYMVNQLHYAKERNLLSKSVCEDEIDDLKFKMRTECGYIVRRYQSYAEAEQMERFRNMLLEKYNKKNKK